MSVRVRLTRVGSKKNPIWRVVVADQRSPRDGRFIEMIGHYNPQTDPSTIVIDDERLQHWLARGAQPTGTVKQLVKAHGKGLTADPRTSTAPPVPTPEPPPAEDAPDSEASPAEEQQPVAEQEAPVAEETLVAEDAPAEEAPAAEQVPVGETPGEETPGEDQQPPGEEQGPPGENISGDEAVIEPPSGGTPPREAADEAAAAPVPDDSADADKPADPDSD
jgi:small subunit ribosomal protein S16